MRLPEYDYSMPGPYFVTTCTKNRELLFDAPEATLAVESAWYLLLDIFANMELGEFVVMPNHVHCVVWIVGEGCYRLHPGTWKNNNIRGDGQLSIPTNVLKFENLSNIIGAFKTTAATQINKSRGVIGQAVWQKSFYDRIVRNECKLERIHKYIQNNPIRWAEDQDNPSGPRFRPPPKSIDGYWNEIFVGNV